MHQDFRLKQSKTISSVHYTFNELDFCYAALGKAIVVIECIRRRVRAICTDFESHPAGVESHLTFFALECICRSDCHSCTGILPTLAGDCPRALTGRK